MEIPESEIRKLQVLWKEAGRGDLSFSKAKKKLQNLVDRGCPLAAHCKDCPKCFDGTCPALPLEDNN